MESLAPCHVAVKHVIHPFWPHNSSCPRSLGFEPIAELVMLDQRHVVRFGETEHTPSLIVQSLLMVLYPSEALQNPYQFPINHIWNTYINSLDITYYTIPVKSVNSHINPIVWLSYSDQQSAFKLEPVQTCPASCSSRSLLRWLATAWSTELPSGNQR